MAAFSNAIVGIFWVLIEVLVYTVFFTHGNNRAPVMNGLSLAQVVSYAWIGQILYPLQPMDIDPEIRAKITSGDVGIELCRPMDLYAAWFVRTGSGRLNVFFYRGGATLLAGLLLPKSVGLSGPDSPAGFAFFLLAVASACALCTAFGTLICAVRLGITWGEGPTYMLLLIGGVLSGGYLPLQLWPDALQGFLLYQPFAGYLDIPARLYIGSMPPSQALPAIVLQLVWTLAFILFGRALLRRKLKSVIIQGG